MKCPHCGKTITRQQIASEMGSVTSDLKAATSADNGKDWQRPHFRKVEHFLSLGLFEGLVHNEWHFKVRLRDGTTYNPDFYHPASECYIEVATSKPNISTQCSKWKKAMKLIKLRVFWWEGEELTGKLNGPQRQLSRGTPAKED